MLTEPQIAVLEAVVNTLIPPDDYPGGWDAGVGDYLFRQFDRDLKDVVSIYVQGLTAIDAEAQAASGAGFAALTPDVREELLAKVEQGRVQTAWPVAPAVFFAMLVAHCAEGFYSDPGNGGNRDNVAWKMIGFEVTG